MEFIKFPKIENMAAAPDADPKSWEAAHRITTWIVTEKLDGCNVSVTVDGRGGVAYGKRTGFLKPDEDLYGFNTWVQEHAAHLMRCIGQYAEERLFDGGLFGTGITQITLFGEYFGDGIMNRVKYVSSQTSNREPVRHVLFFGACVRDREGRVIHLPYAEFLKVMGLLSAARYTAPILGVFGTFEAACRYPVEGVTTFYDPKTEYNRRDNLQLMEGVVVQPLFENPVSEAGNFRFKNKNPQFEEQNDAPKEPPSDEQRRDDALRNAFVPYLVESRMYAVFSKLGKPENRDKSAGTYIQAFLNDAWEDFVKAHDIPDGLSKSSLNKIKKADKNAFALYCRVFNAVGEGGGDK